MAVSLLVLKLSMYWLDAIDFNYVKMLTNKIDGYPSPIEEI